MFSGQGLKRLKKAQLPIGRCGQLPSFEGTTVKGPGSNFGPHTVRPKEDPNSTRDRFAEGTTLPISINYKKVAHEEALSKHSEHQKDGRIQQKFGKGAREQSPIDIAPKRLKIKGPSFGV